ncbi:MAG: oxidoreductase [Planctomyces sp.]|nr:oxidoreductase [Planctomyces sp.]
MNLTENDLVFVTGATGLVGSHVVEECRKRNVPVRVLARAGSSSDFLKEWGVEMVTGDLTDAESLKKGVAGATVVVHCAAKVGDWGPVEDYRKVNVDSLETFLQATENSGTLKKFIHISSLGVYQARDHHGTDESEPPNQEGIDGYTLTKVESELKVLDHVKEKQLPAVVIRPGFVYGPRDRTVLPRIFEKLKSKQFAFLGSGEKLMNNVFVGNLVQAIFKAIENDDVIGEKFNVTDGRLVSKKEFINKIAELGGYPPPKKHVPLPVAKFLANVLEKLYRALGKTEAPILSNARIKFLGLNLDYSTAKAKRELGYDPQIDFQEGMKQTMDWFKAQGLT